MKANIRKVDFTNKEIYIGLDVHTKSWYSTIIFEGVSMKKNFTADSTKLAQYLQLNFPNGTYKAAYEAGCFGFWIKEELDGLGIETIVVNPSDIPTMGKDKVNKTDKKDSNKIAMALKGGMLTGIYVPTKEEQEHRCLTRRRNDIVKSRTRIKNKIKAYLKLFGISIPEQFSDNGKQWTKAFMKWLSEIKFRTEAGIDVLLSYIEEFKNTSDLLIKVSKKIKELSKTEKYSKQVKILSTMPGIAINGSMTILTELGNMDRFKTIDEFINYVGLSPKENSSGESRKIGHMSKRCNHYLRKIFIEGSWVAIRKDTALTLSYNEYCKRMLKTKAIIKIGRKLASRARYLLLNNQEYIIGIAQ